MVNMINAWLNTPQVKKCLRAVTLTVIAALLCSTVWLSNCLQNAQASRDLYKTNMESALTECVTWKTKDSLSAAKNDILTLRIAELEKYKADDLATIKSLKKRNESLNSLITEMSETKVEVITEIKDSIVYVDSTKYAAKVFQWKDAWIGIDGTIIGDVVDLDISSKDSIVVGVTTRYKKFLGFLWNTNKIKSQQVYAVSKNPHNTIENIECINIK